MPAEQRKAGDSWVSRFRQRRADRRSLQADRRARRRAKGSPDDAARQGESATAGSGGFFTTKTRAKP